MNKGIKGEQGSMCHNEKFTLADEARIEAQMTAQGADLTCALCEHGDEICNPGYWGDVSPTGVMCKDFEIDPDLDLTGKKLCKVCRLGIWKKCEIKAEQAQAKTRCSAFVLEDFDQKNRKPNGESTNG